MLRTGLGTLGLASKATAEDVQCLFAQGYTQFMQYMRWAVQGGAAGFEGFVLEPQQVKGVDLWLDSSKTGKPITHNIPTFFAIPH